MNHKEQLPSQEELLLDYAERLANHRRGREAVHIHLSRLQRELRHEHHLRIAAETFDPLIKRYEGQIFRLGNSDMVVIVKGARLSEIDEYVLKLRFFFREDPLFAREVEDGEADPFTDWYDIQTDYSAFLSEVYALVERQRSAAGNPFLAVSDDEEVDVEPLAMPPKPPIGPVELARIEATLASVDVAPFIQRHVACAVHDDGAPRPAFCDYVISFDAIERALTPKHDLKAEPWLFERMQAIVNPRILSELTEIARGGNLPIGIKLPIPTILSSQFLKFHRDYRPKIRRRMLIEIEVADVFVNTSSFVFARDFLRDRDYRVSMGGLSFETFGLVDRDALDVDFEKLAWSPRMAQLTHGHGLEEFRDTVIRTGVNRVVLAGCNSRRALDVGRELGIRIFQGSYITQALHRSGSRPEAASA
jgi:hypothetical protein